MAHLTATHGRVDFNISRMPGCCGVTIIHNVAFAPRQGSNVGQLYTAFMQHLKRRAYGDSSFSRRVGKILMTDVEPDPTAPVHAGNIYDFCMTFEDEWEVGEPANNPKTDNQLVVFELNLPRLTHRNQMSVVTNGMERYD